MWSRYASGSDGKSLGSIFHVPIDSSIVGLCKREGSILNIPDASKHKEFNADKAKEAGFVCREVLCAPVRDRGTGEVVAVVEFLNKKGGGGFKADDERLAKMLAHHVAIFLERIDDDDD